MRDPLNELFTGQRLGGAIEVECRHIWLDTVHVIRQYPGTVTICKQCQRPLRFTPDRVIEAQPIVIEKVRRVEVERAINGRPLAFLILFVVCLALLLGLAVGVTL